MGVEHLKRSRDTKNDEFYTQYCDIKKEMQYRQNNFIDKVVWCPCDNYKTSNFVKYFKDNFHKLGLRTLIATCIKNATISQDASFYVYDGVNEKVEPLTDGSFESNEVIECVFPYIDNKGTVVVTNPPFSKIRTFLPYMLSIENNATLDLLFIAPPNIICYVDVFTHIKLEELRVSYNHKISNYIQCLSPYVVYGDKEYPVYNFDHSNDVVVPDGEVCFISVPISYITKKVPSNLKLFDFSNNFKFVYVVQMEI